MITPIEIRQQQFRKGFRGYDPEEVQAFLTALSQEWEKQLENQRSLRAELEKIQASYRTLKEVEDMLHKTLMQAEQSSRDTLDNARQKAELLVQDAEARSREILRKGVEDRNQLQREIEELSRQRDQVIGQLQVFLQAQLDRLHAWERSELPPASHHPAPGPAAPDPAPLFPARDNGSHPRGIVDDIYAEL